MKEKEEVNYLKKEIVTDVEKLSEVCEEVNYEEEKELVKEITLALKHTLRANNNGIGLAAPQIGYNKRIMAINFKGDIRVFVNPMVVGSTGVGLSRESCLSLPDKEFIIFRNNRVKIAYQTPLGVVQQTELAGVAAYTAQHEIDHLDGKLVSDIGLEIDERYGQATEEERAELIKAYKDSLDKLKEKLDKEIEEDEELSKQKKAIDFRTKVLTGEVKVVKEEVNKEDSEKIKDKLKEELEKESK